MKIVMKKTASGAYDGVNVRSYPEGEEFEIGSQFMPRALADAFIAQGVAEETDTGAKKSPPGPSEMKDPHTKEADAKKAQFGSTDPQSKEWKPGNKA